MSQVSDPKTRPDRPRAVTLKDVAARAGVGPMSVSAVLNSIHTPTRVSEPTRRRIIQAAEELGYRRNGGAAATRSGKFGNVVFVISSSSNRSYFSQDLIIGITRELAVDDIMLSMVQLPDERLTDEGFLPNIARKLSCDGVILDYNVDIPSGLVALVEKYAIPSVWLNVERPSDSLFPDDEKAAFDATESLLRLGHTRIMHVTNHVMSHESVAKRWRGYENAMAGAGLIPRVEQVNLDGDAGPVYGRVRDWLGASGAPTAVFGYGANYVIPIWVAAEAMGKTVPRDLSLIAINDREVRMLGHQLTCWEIPYCDMGIACVRMLMRKIEAPTVEIPSTKMAFTIKPGETCAPVRQSTA